MAVSRRLRFEILRRDGHTCRYCGAKAPDVALTVDHVVPSALGGTDDPTNLVTACAPCNSGKTSVSPNDAIVADVAADTLRLRTALERVADERRQEISNIEEMLAWFADTWDIWGRTKADGSRMTVPREHDWAATVERFISLTLDRPEFVRFVRVAMTAKNVAWDDRWRYFCGCCWNEITRRQEAAKAAFSTPAAEDGDDIDTESDEYMAGYDDGFTDGRHYGAMYPPPKVTEHHSDAWGDPLAGDPLAGDPAEGGE